MKPYVFCQGELDTNCVLLVSEDRCVLVDVPFGSVEAFRFVKDNNLKLQAVLLTHGHFDHCGGVQEMLGRLGLADIPIYAHEADYSLCHKASQNRWGVHCQDCFPTHPIVEGHLDVGDFNFQVLETPGHTAGSVVYLIDRLIISGDTLFQRSVGRIDFAESKPHLLVSSLKKIKALSGDYAVICGHGPNTTLESEKKFNPYLQHETIY